MMNTAKENAKITPKESALINAYHDGNLSFRAQADLENLVSTNSLAAKTMRERTQQREQLKGLIPNKRPKRESHQLLMAELREVTTDLFKEKKPSFTDRLAKFLDTTVLEF